MVPNPSTASGTLAFDELRLRDGRKRAYHLHAQRCLYLNHYSSYASYGVLEEKSFTNGYFFYSCLHYIGTRSFTLIDSVGYRASIIIVVCSLFSYDLRKLEYVLVRIDFGFLAGQLSNST